jgi:hypothetical protein
MSVDPDAPPSDNWLLQFILIAIDQGVCVSTTFGARAFREALLAEAIDELDDGCRTPTGEEIYAEIARAVALLAPPVRDDFDFERVVRLILSDLWRAMGSSVADRTLAPLLAGTWAGDVLARMKAHYDRRVEARRRNAVMNDPLVVERRRAEKKRLKQQRHTERLARKAEHDRLWRAKQGKGEK